MIIRLDKRSPSNRVMEVLWFAIVIYSVGLAVILHFRPALMFNDDGTWKEFGYQRSPRHTLLPFWLFVIAWAFVSYVAATSMTWMFFSNATRFAATAATLSYSSQSESDSESESESDDEMTPASTIPLTSSPDVIMPPRRGPGRPRKTESASKPVQSGYYVRENTASEGGLHRYIYYGPDAPGLDTPGQVAAIKLPNATP